MRCAAAEPRLAGVADADGVPRPRAERGHARTMVSQVGPVVVGRMAYRAAGQPTCIPGCGAEPAAAPVFLGPAAGRWWGTCWPGPMSRPGGSWRPSTGVVIGKRQLEQITIEAAADAAGFYPALARDQGRGRGRGGGWAVADLGGLQGGGDAARGAAPPRRQGPRPAGAELREAARDRGEGAQADGPARVRVRRRPGAAAPRSRSWPPAGGKQAPRALRRWYTADIAADRAETIRAVFDEAERRDPRHERTWVALVDGDNHQIEMIRDQAAARGIDLVILIDFIHVLEYLWKAAWCFHPPRDPAIEAWVTAQALDILHGRAAQVTETIRQLAAARPPAPGSEHAKIIRKTLTYLDAKEPYLDYPRALASGWPIATGVIEGACRHLVQDRMGITGARWGLEGAQAILWLRAIRANGDLDTYWDWHITQEHHRNHLSRYQPGLELAA